jgi:cytochrome c oxidase subunit 4
MTKHVSALSYILVFVALLVLATASLVASFLHAGVTVAMIIAFIKSVLVLFFFMHLIEQSFTNRLTIFVSLGFVALLVGLTCADVASRYTPAPAPSHSDRFYIR